MVSSSKDLKWAIDKLNRLTLQGHQNLEIKSKSKDSDGWVYPYIVSGPHRQKSGRKSRLFLLYPLHLQHQDPHRISLPLLLYH